MRTKFVLFMLLIGSAALASGKPAYPADGAELGPPAPISGAIGRVGNNTIGTPDFSTKMPAPYITPLFEPDGSAQLIQGSGGMDTVGDGLSISPLAVGLPDAVGLDPAQLSAYLSGTLGLEDVAPVRSPACATYLVGHSPAGTLAVAEWAGGVGYVVTADAADGQNGVDGIMEILSTTVIAKPCAK